ncbi:MAG TPA: NTP transferase domain-containing protein, partial [Burkholderiales bacterium]|nr:NTP transferase domain-containing protein [Burkholderiales bacterium]
MQLDVIVLAAGQGKRMNSDRPKVLHELAGKPLLGHVIDTARELKPRRIFVVHGHGAEAVRVAFPDKDVEWVLQAEQLGTGHAVQQAVPKLAADAQVLILYGDVPLVSAATLKRLIDASRDGVAVLTAELPDAGAYGRIVRDGGSVKRIVEAKDA